MNGLDRITFHPEMMGGRACIRGTGGAASGIARRLRKREAAAPAESEQESVDAKPKIWHRIDMSQIPHWVNAVINAVINAAKFWGNKEGVG